MLKQEEQKAKEEQQRAAGERKQLAEAAAAEARRRNEEKKRKAEEAAAKNAAKAKAKAGPAHYNVQKWCGREILRRMIYPLLVRVLVGWLIVLSKICTADELLCPWSWNR